MVLRRFTDFILKSRLQAMGTAFICAFIPLVGSVSVLISAFVTLRKNTLDGFYILVAATLPLFIGLYGYTQDAGADSFSNLDIVLLMVVCNVLTWAFAILLRKYASWNLLLQLAAFICLVTVIAAHLLNPDIQTYWQTHLTNYLNSTMQAVSSATGDASQKIGTGGGMVQTISPYFTGFVSIFAVFYALVQLLLARWWQGALYNRGGLSVELDNIRLSYAAGIVFIICFMFVMAGNATADDAIPILYLTFALAGFSVLHVLIASRSKAWLWNALLCLFIFVIPPSMVLIALIALLDTGIDLRKRLVKKINVS